MKSSSSRGTRYGFFPRIYRSFGWALYLGLALVAYLAFEGIFRLLVLTCVTYFMRGARFEEISESFFPNEILAIGVGSAIFILAWRGVSPWLQRRPLIEPKAQLHTRTVREWLAGLTQGSLLAVGLLTAFLVSDLYRFLGTVFRAEEAPWTLLLLALRATALACLAISQEWIFRGVVFDTLRARMPKIQAVGLAALIYVLMQSAFFQFGWMQSLSFGLLSTSLSLRRSHGGSLSRGAGYFFAIMAIPHLLASLPLFGSEFTGIFLIKPTIQDRWLTGGAAGPFSSFAFQAILVTDILRQLYRIQSGSKQGNSNP